MAKATMNNGKSTTLYFDEETSKRCKSLAESLSLSMSAYLRLLVQREFESRKQELWCKKKKMRDLFAFWSLEGFPNKPY